MCTHSIRPSPPPPSSTFSEVLEKYKKIPKMKAHMHIFFFCMVPISIVHSTLKIVILKIEQMFQMGYHKGDKMFYGFPTN
jgi:hypothetical protein